MNLTRNTWRFATGAGLALVLAACDSRPFERAGKAVDGAVEKTGDKVKEITK